MSRSAALRDALLTVETRSYVQSATDHRRPGTASRPAAKLATDHGIFAPSSIEFVASNGSRSRNNEFNEQTRARFHVARADDGSRSRRRADRGGRPAAARLDDPATHHRCDAGSSY